LEMPWALGINSATRGEGRTTAAMSLAGALAWETGDQIALMECDYESPCIADELDVDPSPGLLDYVEGMADLESTFRPARMENLTVIPVGTGHGALPGQLGGDEAAIRLRHELSGIVRRLKQQFSCIVVDMPPLTSVHAEGMAVQMDAALVLARAGVTPEAGLKDAVAAIGEEKMLGVVYMGGPSALPGWISSILSE